MIFTFRSYKLEREKTAGLGMWSILVVQSEHWQAGGREAQANMKETDGERLP